MYSCTLLGTNISPFKGSFWRWFFHFQRWDMWSFPEGYCYDTVNCFILKIRDHRIHPLLGSTLPRGFPGLSGCVAKGVHFERDPTSSSTFQVGESWESWVRGFGWERWKAEDICEITKIKIWTYIPIFFFILIYIYYPYIYFTIFEMVEWMIGNQQSKVTDIPQMTFWIIFSTRGGASDECHTFTPPVLVEVGGDPKSYTPKF